MTGTVLHIITGLATGGAETMLCKLIEATSAGPIRHSVVSLMDEGTLGARIRQLGAPVYSLDLRSGRVSPGALLRLRRHLREVAPAAVQGWMYHGNLAASLAMAANPPRRALAWNVRQSLYEMREERPLTRVVIRLNALLSRRPAAIVFNSETSLRQHVEIGFDAGRCRVIPNGFDLHRFRPDAAVRTQVRQELGFDADAVLVGLVARLHPVKDHATFLRAGIRLVQRRPEARLVLAGRGVEPGNAALVTEIERMGLQPYVRLLGEHPDTAKLLPGLDVLCSSSWGEAFPNVVGEAMACEVPCVVTDVGDSAMIVGDSGRVVPPRDPDAMASALEAMLAMPADERVGLGREARARVEAEFSLEHVAREYERMYEELGQYVRN